MTTDGAVVKIVGKVTECYVDDVSKQAGKRVPVSYLSVEVERTEPADVKARLRHVEQFRASLPSPYADLHLQAGARVEVLSSVPAGARADEAEPLDIQALRSL